MVTALVGGVVWAIVGFFFGWMPLLGPLLALVASVAVINYRCSGGWVSAIGISLVAWVAALVVLYLLAVVGIASFDALGGPGA